MKQASDKLPLYWGLLPAIATVFGLVLLDEALVAVLLYHTGIIGCLLWKRFRVKNWVTGGNPTVLTAMGSVCLLTWPVICFLWPVMVLPGVDLAPLLIKWRITGGVIWIFVIYSITLHPLLEETFWRGMMPDHWASDCLFAGFHLLVLASLVHAVWLPVSFAVLVTASFLWRMIVKKFGGLLIPILTHALADLGVILAVRRLLTGTSPVF